MRCTDCRQSLNPYLDGELTPRAADDVRDHVAGCSECSREYDSLAATSHLLQDGLVHYPAPDVLKARILGALAQPNPFPESVAPSRTRWIRLAAAGVAIALFSSAATIASIHQRGASRSIKDDVLTSHLRSLMAGHLTDVASNDQHNVKPWFNGRVSLSPPVPRLDSAGFVLAGGRLDYLAGHPAAAVVYLRRQHVINVFSWPDAGGDTHETATTTQGYHLVTWRHDDIAFWVVSDLNSSELADFVARFHGHGGRE